MTRITSMSMISRGMAPSRTRTRMSIGRCGTGMRIIPIRITATITEDRRATAHSLVPELRGAHDKNHSQQGEQYRSGVVNCLQWQTGCKGVAKKDYRRIGEQHAAGGAGNHRQD